MTGAAACTLDETVASESVSESETQGATWVSDRPVLIQPGALLNVLGVVGDDWVIYQDGSTIFASRLVPGARRIAISDTPVFSAHVLVTGDVALIWPDQAQFGATVPSRLIVWSPRTGARLASERSVTPTNTGLFSPIAVSPDGRSVVFIDRVDATASRGDLVLAPVDLSAKTTIAANVDVDYATLRCPPAVLFSALRGRARPLAAYCALGETTATLATVERGTPRTLATGLRARPRVYAREDVVVTVLADLLPAVVDFDGTVTRIDTRPANHAFPTDDGKIFALSRIGTAVELAELDPTSGLARTITPPIPVVFQGHAPVGVPYYTDSFLSRDDKKALFATAQDPATGLFAMSIVDVTTPATPAVALSTTPTCGTSFELFTRDSSHALFYCFQPGFVASLFAGSLDSPARQISSGAAVPQHFGVAGSTIVYADNADNAATPPTFDLRLADVADPNRQRTVVTKASTGFVVTADRRFVVYSRDIDAASAGIYVSRLR